MKLVDVLQWVTKRDGSRGSPTRPTPAGGSVGNPACVGSDPGCEARGNEEVGRTLSPEICIVVDNRITPTPRQRGKADALHSAEGSNPRSLAAVQRGYHRGLRTRHVSTGRTWELGRSNTLLNESRSKGNRGINVPGLAEWRPLAPVKSEERGGREVPEGEAIRRSPRDGLLEVLAERSTDGRTTGRKPGRSGRRGSETQATRCREGEVGHNALTEGNRRDT